MFTDSIPIAAIIAKPLTRLFGWGDWQYFSILSLLNALLIAWCVQLIARIRSWSIFATLIAGVLLISSSLSWSRLQVGHESLQLHSLLILALAWIVQRQTSLPRWCLLCAVAVGIHPYYLPMLVPAAMTQLWKKSDRHTNIISFFFLNLSICISAWACGFLPGSAGSGSKVWGANVLSLLDPQDHSLMFSALAKREPFDIEGFCYLGIGIAIGVLLCLSKPYFVPQGKPLFPRSWWIVSLFLFAIALGPSWAIGGTSITPVNALCKIPGFCLFYDIFRSAGRFTWPLTYSVIIWTIDQLILSGRFALLAILACLQMSDSNLYVLHRQRDAYSRRLYSPERSPAHLWLDRHPQVWAAMKQADLFLLGPLNDKLSIPPGFTPQYANPKLMSNWGGEGMTRVPRDLLGDQALAFWLNSVYKPMITGSSHLTDHQTVLVMTDDSALLSQIYQLAHKRAFHVKNLGSSFYLISGVKS